MVALTCVLILSALEVLPPMSKTTFSAVVGAIAFIHALRAQFADGGTTKDFGQTSAVAAVFAFVAVALMIG
jgi:hypothetical protein